MEQSQNSLNKFGTINEQLQNNYRKIGGSMAGFLCSVLFLFL